MHKSTHTSIIDSSISIPLHFPSLVPIPLERVLYCRVCTRDPSKVTPVRRTLTSPSHSLKKQLNWVRNGRLNSSKKWDCSNSSSDYHLPDTSLLFVRYIGDMHLHSNHSTSSYLIAQYCITLYHVMSYHSMRCLTYH
jgi:hypothetical protein